MEDQYDFFVDEGKPWFQPEAGWPETVPKNMQFPRITLYEMLKESVDLHADRPAVWFLNTFMTYRELLQGVDATAAGLHRVGFKKGDVLAIALPSMMALSKYCP